jgi:hypothetical protein
MNFTPSKVQIGTAAFESYQRDSLTGNGRANLPISPIEEYFFIGIYNVNRNTTKTVELSQFGGEIKLESIYIDSPATDQFTFEVLDENEQILTSFALGKNQTPYEFPAAILAPNHKVRIIAQSDLASIRIYAKPVKIIDSIVV